VPAYAGRAAVASAAAAGGEVPDGERTSNNTAESAFAMNAHDLARRGFGVMPLGGDDGKVPLITWKRLRHRPGRDYISKLITKFPNANIGVICSLSGVTIVDIDEPALLSLMLARFGDTPLRTFTPSGGVHLWYRSSGERCRNLRKTEGLDVDIKGIGGQVVVPPSVRLNGAHAGGLYGFLVGSWDDIPRLPLIPAEAFSQTAGADADTPTPLRAVKKGYRNDVLFTSLLRHAKGCNDIEALLDKAHTINTHFNPPLDALEVLKCTASAWGYEIEGRNWVGKEARVYVLKSELNALAAHKNGGDGLLLLSKLRIAHWGHNAAFPVSAKAMATARSIPEWDPKRYRRAIEVILATHLLQKVHHGGRGVGDPSLFAFANAAAHKGPDSGPNITNTPPSPASPGSERSEIGRGVDVEVLKRDQELIKEVWARVDSDGAYMDDLVALVRRYYPTVTYEVAYKFVIWAGTPANWDPEHWRNRSRAPAASVVSAGGSSCSPASSASPTRRRTSS
jgi:hypothetical protein